MIRALAFSLLLPLAGTCGEVKSGSLTSIESGRILRADDCDPASHACFALLLTSVKGRDAAGAEASLGDVLLEGAWSQSEAADDLAYLAIGTGKTSKPGIKVEFASFRYGVSTAPLSGWTRRGDDSAPVRRARVVFTTTTGDTSVTFGLGKAE